MSYFTRIDLGESFEPLARLRRAFGFRPNLFLAQTLLPRVIEAEARIADGVLLKDGALTRVQKESILLAISAAHQNDYCTTAHAHVLKTLGSADAWIEAIATDHRRAGLPPEEVVLLDFACRLSGRPTSISRADIDDLRRHGFTDAHILEAILTTALTEFLCTLSAGVGAVPDFEPRAFRPARRFWIGTAAPADVAPLAAAPGGPRAGSAAPVGAPRDEAAGPYLRAADMPAASFPPFAFFRDRFGFIPGIFRAQTLRPDVVEAEAHAVGAILLSEDVLSRERKEYILLVISAANLNTYCVAVHSEMLRMLGVPEETSERIAVDHRNAPIPEADRALLDFALKLARRPRLFSRDDIDALRRHGFSAAQALEAVVMASLTNFLNTLQMGLGTTPDFPPKRVFADDASCKAGGGPGPADPRSGSASGAGDDDDGALVGRARGGDLAAFETLVRRHHRRVYRALRGITGNHEDAEDGAQNTFLKAYKHLGDFEGACLFSTWLTRIAINEGVERLRRRKDTESLDALMSEGGEEAEPFRPGDLQAWTEDPERLYSRVEMRALIEKELMGLPAKYRLAVFLRDIEHLSTGEAATAMGVGEAAFKTRLSRARLMLREALTPHFANRGRSDARD